MVRVFADAAVQVLDQACVALLILTEELLELVHGDLQRVHGVRMRLDAHLSAPVDIGATDARGLHPADGLTVMRPEVHVLAIGLQPAEPRIDAPDGVLVDVDILLRGAEPALQAVEVLLLLRQLGADDPAGLPVVLVQSVQAMVVRRPRPRERIYVLRHVAMARVQALRQLFDPCRLLRLGGEGLPHLGSASVQRADLALEVLALLLHCLHHNVCGPEVSGDLGEIRLCDLVVGAELLLHAV
mmetsp:Transcript_73093/g.218075  ORF Transcript_73093/g.218075 Transcript_73093/m.218075 type:complete len:242 (+) Transcript_73093:712-1437(+)